MVTVRRAEGFGLSGPLARYERPVPSPEELEAPPRDTDVVRTHPDSVELVLTRAGTSEEECRRLARAAFVRGFGYWIVVDGFAWAAAAIISDAAVGTLTAVGAMAMGAASVLIYGALVAAMAPHALSLTFAPAEHPDHLTVHRWLRGRRIPLGTVTGITVVEHRERSGPARDATRDPRDGKLLGFDVVVHRAGRRAVKVRGTTSTDWRWFWRPDTRLVYTRLAALLDGAGVRVDEEVRWRSPIVRSSWLPGGCGGGGG